MPTEQFRMQYMTPGRDGECVISKEIVMSQPCQAANQILQFLKTMTPNDALTVKCFDPVAEQADTVKKAAALRTFVNSHGVVAARYPIHTSSEILTSDSSMLGDCSNEI